MEWWKRIGPSWRLAGFILALLLLSRFAVYGSGYLGMNLFPNYTKEPEYVTMVQGGETVRQLKLPHLLSETKVPSTDTTWKFDTNFYTKIATEGYDKYRMDEKHSAANWVFFPLYPLLLYLARKVVSWLNPLEMGVLLSNLYLFGALVYLYLICRERGMQKGPARMALFFLLLYPTSVYLSVPYTESLFLLLSCGAVYHALKGQYLLAFLLGGLSGATRIVGFINVFFVAGHVLVTKQFRWRHLLYAALSGVPLLSFFLYMKKLTGDFLAPIHEQSVNWFRGTTVPFGSYVNWLREPYLIGSGGWDNGLIEFAVATVVFAAFAGYAVMQGKRMWRDLGEGLFFLYGVLLIAVPFSSGESMTSIPRYLMSCVPLYVYLAAIGQRFELVRMGTVLFFVMLNVFFTVGYFNDYFFVV
ncbi:MAG: mannosyltransferase family protein [Tumebacillaceae bacterium]